MRRLGAVVGCIAALLTSACAPVSEQYFREGVGDDLNSGQLAQATQLQDQYVYYICRQAGGLNEETFVGSSCDGANWTAFTVAGMNDIDQRCDAYLNWLDAQRRDRTPVLSQIAAMGAATSGIMGVAGAGTQAIAIVATAFGLAGTTYANWNSRLLLDVDHSTVQSVVYRRQQQYRDSIVSLAVTNRAAAIYLLRGYLRLCMPITIETDINNTVTLVQNGASLPVVRAPLVQPIPLVATAPVPASTPVTSHFVRPKVNPAPGWEKVSPGTPIDLGTAKLIQRSLCIANPDGKYDNQTEFGLKIYLSYARTSSYIDPAWRSREVLFDKNGHDIASLLSNRCVNKDAKNFLESAVLASGFAQTVGKLIRQKYGITEANKGILELRPEIEKWRIELGLSNAPDDLFNDQLTPDFLAKILPKPEG